MSLIPAAVSGYYPVLFNNFAMTETANPATKTVDAAITGAGAYNKGAYVWDAVGVITPLSPGFLFDGTSGYFLLPNFYIEGLVDAWSVFCYTCYVKFDAEQNGGGLLSARSMTGPEFFPQTFIRQLVLTPTSFSYRFDNNLFVQQTITGTPSIPQDNAWHSMIFLCNLGETYSASLWIDGNPVILTIPGVAESAEAGVAHSAKNAIGCCIEGDDATPNYADTFFDGSLKELMGYTYFSGAPALKKQHRVSWV